MPKMTAQMIYDDCLRKYERIEESEGWDVTSSTDDYNAGRAFAYADVMTRLLMLEEVEHAGEETDVRPQE